MKKIPLILFFTTLLFFNAFPQSPQAIPYQAVARNASGNLIASQNISLRFSIHTGTLAGVVVYSETQSATTNTLGLFSVNIGLGTPVTGTFSGVNWGTGAKFLQVELDITGGTTYTNMGTQQMMSVPYALYAATTSREYMYAAFVGIGSSQTVTVGSPFVFNNVTSSANITLTTSNTVHILVTGTYQVSYYMTNINSTERTIALKVNATVATNTPIIEVTAENIGSTAILNLNAGDNLQLINFGTSSITTNSIKVAASITVVQVN